MKILLIGGGFVGVHLMEALKKRGHEVHVADLPAVAAKNPGFLPIDIENLETVRSLFRQVRPDRVFLLAAVSSVALSWRKPDLTVRVNVLGTLNVLTAMKEIIPEARLIYVGSGEEYGTRCSEEHPFDEEMNCDPRNPYAVSKFASGQILELLAVRDRLDIVHLRPSNHFGPGQREGFVIPDFCSQIVRIERGEQPPVLKVGCLDARRDFLFVEDVVAAYTRIAEASSLPHTVYNLSSGQAHSIREMLDLLLSMSLVPVNVEIDPAKFRPVDVPVLVASSRRAYEDLQWKPAHSLKESLSVTLNWWRTQDAGPDLPGKY